MHFDKAIIPFCLRTLEAEIDLAKKGVGAFADQNGIVYLCEAADKLEENLLTGFDHTHLRPQVWSALSSLAPLVLADPLLSDENYGKLLKLFLLTNLEACASRLIQMSDESVRQQINSISNQLNFIIRIR